jgi:membrane protein CcdC involved in cytochrome C biogenesis
MNTWNTWLLVSSLLGAALVLAYRVRESRRPITQRLIIIPPLGMSTGFGMFIYAPMRIPPLWAAAAFLVGALVFSYPLIKTSKLKLEGDAVMLRRSRAFLWILVGLIIARITLRSYVEQYISPLQTASVFFVLAFGTILTWRVRMLVDYRRLLHIRSHDERENALRRERESAVVAAQRGQASLGGTNDRTCARSLSA